MDVSQTPARSRIQWNLSFPVLMKEMRSRMRGIRAPILLFITTGLTILVGLLIVGMQWGSYADGPYGTYGNMADIGKSLFIGLVILEGILCSLIAPALTAGAVSIEREQQTLELLLLTRLSCTNIILGKLLSSLGFLVVVLLCSLPVWAISFLLGGVDLSQFFWSLAMIFVSVTLFGAIALYCSTRFAKTATAVAVAYCFCILWLAIVPIFFALFMGIYGYGSSSFTDLAASNWKDVPFVVFAFGSSAVLALIPTAVLSILIGLVFRHALSRAANVVLWAGITAIGMVALVSYPATVGDLVQSSDGLLLMLGNPVVAVAAIIEPSGFSRQISSPFFEKHFVALTAGITLFFALLVVVQSVQEMKRLRNGPPDLKVKQRPRKVRAASLPPAPVA